MPARCSTATCPPDWSRSAAPKPLKRPSSATSSKREGGTAAPASHARGRQSRASRRQRRPLSTAGTALAASACSACSAICGAKHWNCSGDPVRATLALGGSLLLMFVIGFGITMDVEDLSYAVLDRDQTTLSQSYTLNLAGSRYFTEHAPIIDYDDLDRRMRSGELSLAIEIPLASAATCCGARTCRSAPGSTAPCRNARKPCRATFRACTSTGCWYRPASAAAPAPQAMPASRRAFATTPMSRACRPWCRR